MKKFIVLFLVCNSSFAQTFHSWDDPSKKFQVDDSKFQTTVVATDNVQKICEKESRNRGFSGFGYTVNSCAFWNDAKTECTIIVPRNASMHLLGHELLHCIKGNWH